MKILFWPNEPDDSATDSAAWIRGLAHSSRADGLTVEVVEPDRPVDPDEPLDRFQPDAVVVVGTSLKAREILAQARVRRVVRVLATARLDTSDSRVFDNANALVVPSKFASRYFADTLGLYSTPLPTWVEPDRAIADHQAPRFVTFVDPSAENGAYVFARIAVELGRLRPEIPILIVATRGSGAILAGSGINVLAQGNVHLTERTPFSRDHWRVTRVALIPSLAWDASPRKLAEALTQGIPAVASNRGALPEIQAGTGASLSIPDRITPATRALPSAEEVAPWIDAIVRLWEMTEPTASHQEIAAQSLITTPNAGLMRSFFQSIIADPAGDHRPIHSNLVRRSRSIVLVPYFERIEHACETSLRKLEEAGVLVVRSEGCPQIDVARNALASDALNQGAESIFFIDADIGFDPADALRLLARPEPVISGVYARKRRRAFASIFEPGITEVIFGADSPGPYPLRYAAGGFLRIKAKVLVRMIEQLNLPVCNTEWGRRDWPFFLPLVASTTDGTNHYLGEDWAFSHRLHQIGITPLADTSIRLWHIGSHAYGWEDAADELARHPTYRIKFDSNANSGTNAQV